MNPVLLFFLLFALVLLALSVGLVLYQRRTFEQQKRQVKELLAEAKKIAEEEAAQRDGSAGPPGPDGSGVPRPR